MYNNAYLKYCQRYKEYVMSVNDIRDFIFEKYYKQIGFSKENSYYSMKRLRKKRFVVTCN